MTDYSTQVLLETPGITIRDIVCHGACRHKSAEECAQSTFLVFPYRGVYVRHVGREDAVAEANQVVFFNQGDSYRISHPVPGGDACLSLSIDETLLQELTPREERRNGERFAFKRHRLPLNTRAQSLAATLRHRLINRSAETLEAETLAIELARMALEEPRAGRKSSAREKLVERTKLVLASEPARRWTLAEIAKRVNVSPVYLTQVFRQVEGLPLYRYQLRLRLARALQLLNDQQDLTALGLQLGFSSHSHFTAAFRQVYGQAPDAFRRSVQLR